VREQKREEMYVDDEEINHLTSSPYLGKGQNLNEIMQKVNMNNLTKSYPNAVGSSSTVIPPGQYQRQLKGQASIKSLEKKKSIEKAAKKR
jgi:hypothetical protein